MTFSYLSRGVVYLCSGFEMIEHSHFVFIVMYIFWDIIPLSLIMYYHN